MELYNIIPPEVKEGDNFARNISKIIAENPSINTILEIGSSNGMGSTAALVKGIGSRKLVHGTNLDLNYTDNIKLFCIEASKERCNCFKKNRMEPYIQLYNYCSVGIDDYMEDDQLLSEMIKFPKTNSIDFNTFKQWKEEEISYIRENKIPLFGIENIIQHNNFIGRFDFILIDGSIFTAQVERLNFYEMATWIALDDINDIKNYTNYMFFKGQSNWDLVVEDWQLRNGFAIFKYKYSSY